LGQVVAPPRSDRPRAQIDSSSPAREQQNRTVDPFNRDDGGFHRWVAFEQEVELVARNQGSYARPVEGVNATNGWALGLEVRAPLTPRRCVRPAEAATSSIAE